MMAQCLSNALVLKNQLETHGALLELMCQGLLLGAGNTLYFDPGGDDRGVYILQLQFL